MLARIVFTKDIWTAAIGGRDIPSGADRTIAALQALLAAVQPQFAALVRRTRDRNEWDDAFVDALCTPPVSFTSGSVIAHILTASAIRRQTPTGVLQDLGVADVETRDPIEWERMVSHGADVWIRGPALRQKLKSSLEQILARHRRRKVE